MPWDDRIRQRLKLRDLNILMAVVETGSMGRAAERLGTFQPTISKAIADLEHTLGVRLLDRVPHGTVPTSYARALVTRSTAAFNELKQGIQEIDNLSDPTVGELRIAGSEPIVAGLFPAVIDRLSRRYPRLIFHVTRVATDPPEYRALREREVEFIVGRLPRLDMEDDLKAETLFNDPLCIAAGDRSRWARRRSITLAELIHELWVLAPPDLFIGALATDLFRAFDLPRPRNGVLCSSLHMNDVLLATGRYLAIYSSSRLRLNGRRLGIKVLPVRLPPQPPSIGIVTMKNRTLNPIAGLFLEEMRQVIRSLPKDDP
jgi:DNA-binding transcriptional LysR family regulator